MNHLVPRIEGYARQQCGHFIVARVLKELHQPLGIPGHQVEVTVAVPIHHIGHGEGPPIELRVGLQRERGLGIHGLALLRGATGPGVVIESSLATHHQIAPVSVPIRVGHGAGVNGRMPQCNAVFADGHGTGRPVPRRLFMEDMEFAKTRTTYNRSAITQLDRRDLVHAHANVPIAVRSAHGIAILRAAVRRDRPGVQGAVGLAAMPDARAIVGKIIRVA